MNIDEDRSLALRGTLTPTDRRRPVGSWRHLQDNQVVPTLAFDSYNQQHNQQRQKQLGGGEEEDEDFAAKAEAMMMENNIAPCQLPAWAAKRGKRSGFERGLGGYSTMVVEGRASKFRPSLF